MTHTQTPNRSLRIAAGVATICAACLAVQAAEAPRSHLEPAGDAASPPRSCAGVGLTLSRASGVLRQQLALRRGAGLVVEEVAPGSQASRAGFIQHDVLVRLDDQLLVLPEQLDALLESSEHDDPLACTVLRGGREVVVPMGRERQPALRQARASAAGGGLRPTASALAIVEHSAPKQGPIAAAPLRRLTDETLVRQDDDYQIRLTGGDEKRLVVSDARGHVVFNDAIDTPEGRSRMPGAVRARVEQMERLLERPAAVRPVAEIGQLDAAPIEIR